jgi:hypothetical protein
MTTGRTQIINQRRKPFVKNLIISIDPITEETELNSMKNNSKTFECEDIVDRIYFCPDDLLANFDPNELNKIGILLIEYVRLESAYENLKKVSYDRFMELNHKIEEDSKNFDEEKEKLLKEYSYYLYVMDIITG